MTIIMILAMMIAITLFVALMRQTMRAKTAEEALVRTAAQVMELQREVLELRS